MTGSVAGLLLAAGVGRRFGSPKGLATDPDGTSWLQRTARRLHDGGCQQVYVVVGAAADQVAALVDSGDQVVVAEDFAEGMGASLRAGLRALEGVGPSV
jgi:CTP:molybdopterin cytidylyltransferase MocA